MKTSIEWKPSFEPPDQGFEFLYVNGVYRGNICRGQRLDQERWFATDAKAEGFSSKSEAKSFLEALNAPAPQTPNPPEDWAPLYSQWRHGGWYVHNVRYPNGACGCISNNYADGKWRIVCDTRRKELGDEGDFTFPTRDAAARAEYALAQALRSHMGK